MPTLERGRVARASVLVLAPVAKVWATLTDPAAIRQYMFGTTVTSAWKSGSAIRWRGEWQGRSYEDKGVILEIEPPRLLRYTHFSPLLGLPDLPENYHTVTVRLSPEDAGTRVSLVQDNNDTEEARAHSEDGWTRMLNGLKRLAEE